MMDTRRRFIKQCITVVGLAGLTVTGGVRRLWAAVRRIILPAGTDGTSLRNRSPEELDTRHLAPTPIEQFDTMGQTEYDVPLSAWRLEIRGAVANPRSLTYEDILKLRPIEKKVLLICPGVFSYVGVWKGASLLKLLQEAGLKPGAEKIKAFGPRNGSSRKEETFSLAELEEDRVFLAYAVNGQTLPEKHGFPLRIVAEDRYGDDWVKYLTEIRVL